VIGDAFDRHCPSRSGCEGGMAGRGSQTTLASAVFATSTLPRTGTTVKRASETSLISADQHRRHVLVDHQTNAQHGPSTARSPPHARNLWYARQAGERAVKGKRKGGARTSPRNTAVTIPPAGIKSPPNQPHCSSASVRVRTKQANSSSARKDVRPIRFRRIPHSRNWL
jgi:hypothetical protein